MRMLKQRNRDKKKGNYSSEEGKKRQPQRIQHRQQQRKQRKNDKDNINESDKNTINNNK